MKIKVNDKELTVFRTVNRPHNWIDLFVGTDCAESRISVPVAFYQNGGRIFTSGDRIQIDKGIGQ